MSEPSNAVLEEKINQLTRELVAHKKQTREEFREVQEEQKANEREILNTKAIVSEVNTSMKYVKEAVAEMKGLVNGFTELIKEHNKSIDKKFDDQNTKIDTKMDEQHRKIDGFINSDKREESKKHFRVTVLQVVGMIIVAIIGLYAGGQM